MHWVLLSWLTTISGTPLTLTPHPPTAAAFAMSNGEPLPNPEREGRAECVDAQDERVICCTWQPNAFGQAYTGR